MSKRVYYIYNPATDNFERYYPSWRSRFSAMGRYLLCGAVIGAAFVWVMYVAFGVKNRTYIEQENSRLKKEVKMLDKRVEEALLILKDIRNRDDNFYRVMLRMDPMAMPRRYAGLGNKGVPESYLSLSDADAMIQLSRNVDLLERQLYSQSLSFDELRSRAVSERDKINHVPAVLPFIKGDYAVVCGYGYRVDPIDGGTRFHEGLDFSAPTGTPVYATADGTVTAAAPTGAYGDCVEIDHGYSYVTRFAHLGSIEVTLGQKVSRGDRIGTVGSTGKSLGPHLHYEVRFKEHAVNPVNYYFLDITPEQYRDMMDAAANAGNMMD